MELGDVTLEQRLRDAYALNQTMIQGLSMREIFQVMLDIQAGLRFLHLRHMIHRDLKPANSNASLYSC